MDRDDKKIRKLRDKAEKLRQAGNVKKAKDIYVDLCKLDPNEPRWPHLAGEALRRLGQLPEAVTQLAHAAELYHKHGFDVKCVAMCKVLLVMDPLNETGIRLLEKVSGTDAPSFPMPSGGPPTSSMPALASRPGPSRLPTPPPAPPPRLASKETSPKELQALHIDDLGPLLVEGNAAPGATPPGPPPPPIPPAKPLVDLPPKPERPPGRTPYRAHESLEISIEVEDLEPDAGEPDVAMELTDNSELGFMESLESSQAEVSDKPRRHPTLEPDAPLESLDLEDVMPGTRRKPTGAVARKDTAELFEVPLPGDPPPVPTGDIEEYQRRMTPSRGMPAITPPGLFSKLGIDVMRSLVAKMSYVEKKEGEVIVRQGDVGGSLYVIVHGQVAIVRETDGKRIHVATLSDGEFFGEMALITDTPRVANVEAVTDVEMLEVSRETLRVLIQEFPQVVPTLIKFLKDRLLEIFVKTSELLKPVPEAKRWVLARKFKLYEIKTGKVIVREGKESGGLMIFLAGTARVTRQRRGQTITLGEMHPGSLVGEISLLTGGPAVATVTATSKAWLLAISTRQWKTLTSAFPEMRQYVEDLAARRREENAALIAGSSAFASQTLRLV